MAEEIRKTYSNGEVTIVWQPHKCIHSTRCFRGLPQVFDPAKRPWVNAHGASTQAQIDQVRKCPSGALSYYLNKEKMKPESNSVKIEIIPDGPIIVEGKILIQQASGEPLPAEETTHAFCRCGASKNKPFCDGTHQEIDFKG